MTKWISVELRQAIADRARFIYCRGRRHRCNDARDVSVSELCEQAFKDIGPDGDRRHHPDCRLLRFGNRRRADFRRRHRGAGVTRNDEPALNGWWVRLGSLRRPLTHQVRSGVTNT